MATRLAERQLKQLSAVINVDKIVAQQAVIRSERTRIREVSMGDKFSNIGAGATVVNRSTLSNALNNVSNGLAGPAVAEALRAVAVVVEESGDPEAVESLNGFTEELEREEPRKPRLKAFWNGLVEALPQVAALGDATASLIALFR